MQELSQKKYKRIANAVAEAYQADIYVCASSITNTAYRHLGIATQKPQKRTALLTLVTSGGDLSAAYSIGRLMQKRYDRLILYIPAHCKSAGTLIATASQELIIGECGELGPIDTQLGTSYEKIFRSTLCSRAGMSVISEEAISACVESLEQIAARSIEWMSVKDATTISGTLLAAIFGGLLSKLDPVEIGTAERALRQAIDYAARLAEVGGNIDLPGIDRLARGYADHDFVIDKREASAIFQNVSTPSLVLNKLGDAVMALMRLEASNGGESQGLGSTSERFWPANVKTPPNFWHATI